jgi:hypothetical protein
VPSFEEEFYQSNDLGGIETFKHHQLVTHIKSCGLFKFPLPVSFRESPMVRFHGLINTSISTIIRRQILSSFISLNAGLV